MSESPSNELAGLFLALSKVARAISLMSHEEISKIADENSEIEIKIVRKRIKDPIATEAYNDFSPFAVELSAASDRESAKKKLTEKFPTKKELEQFARSLQIAIQKQDNFDAIKDKIVESTTGARLRSNAIQGKPSSASNEEQVNNTESK